MNDCDLLGLNSILRYVSRNFEQSELPLAISEQAPPPPPPPLNTLPFDPLPAPSPTTTELEVKKIKTRKREKPAKPASGHWKKEHDSQLLELYAKFGGKWREMARNSDLGTDDCLRNRFMRLTEPNTAHKQKVRCKSRKNHESRNPWTPEEDEEAIQAAKDTVGMHPRWQIVADLMGNERTPQAIRNRVARLEMRAKRDDVF